MKSISHKISRLWNFLDRIFRFGKIVIAREVDLRRYKKSIAPYKKHHSMKLETSTAKLLIASGRGMNTVWAQIWTFLALCARTEIPDIYVLTNKKRSFINKYFALAGLHMIDFDYMLGSSDQKIPDELIKGIDEAVCVADFRSMHVGPVPIGDIAISTVCRHRGVGQINDFNSKTKMELARWISAIYKSYELVKTLIDDLKITHTFHTEVFMEEYGGIFYACLEKELKVIRFAGTIRDNAFIVQKLNFENARLHHSSLARSTWNEIKNRDFDINMDKSVSQSFQDRYSNKWYRSKRNYPGNLIEDEKMIYEKLNLSNSKPIAIIFSHILYDSIYFYGSDIYPDYENWLVETIRIAIENPNIEWIIKLHPSNVWRREIDSLLGGQTLEEKLIEKNFSVIPSHLHILNSDCPISPFGLMQIATYGLTVRGTSGLEMAALGKTVVTGGTGRYEGQGFTIDPSNIDEYQEILMNLHHLDKPNPHETNLARRYAYGIFELKAFTFDSLIPHLSFGKKSVVGSDDICYLPQVISGGQFGCDVLEFLKFLNDDRSDLLTNSK